LIQVGLRWILQHPKIATAIVAKADDSAYLAEDLDIFNWSLSDADMGKLSAATVPKGQQDGRPSWGCAQ
jgi:diketogulonate reductase-like aldo/keto reductase